MSITRDISDRKRVLAALKESEERFRTAFMTSPDAMIFSRLDDGRIVDVNAGFTATHQYSADEVIGQRVHELMLWEPPEKRGKYVEALKRDGFVTNWEEIFCRKDGSLFPGLLSARIVHLDGVPHVLAMLRDISEWKAAQEDLRANEERYRTLFGSANDSILIVDPELPGVVDCNAKALEIFGCTREQMLGLLPSQELSPPVQPDGNNSEEEAARRRGLALQGQPQFYEWRHLRADGTPFDTEVSFSRLNLKGKDLLMAITRDISDRKSALAAMKESEERFRLIFQTSPDAITINRYDDTTYIDVNEGFSRVTGYQREEVIGRTTSELGIWQGEDARMKLRAGLEQCGFIDNLEAEFRHKDGEVGLGLLSARTIKLGGIEHLLTVTRSITKWKADQEALQKSEARYRLLVENAPLGILSINADGVLEDANSKALEILGSPSFDELCKDEALNPERGGGANKVGADFQRCLETGQGGVFERAHSSHWGKDLWLRYLLQPIRNPTGEIQGVQAIIEDITDGRKMEAQLRQAQKMEAVGTLAGGIAHDFNNILMGIQGYTSLMLMDAGPGEEAHDALKCIEQAVQSGSDLTRQLLGFARGGKYEAKATDLNELIKRSSQMFGRAKKEIHIHRKFQKDLWAVEVDQGQIEQVLLNLFVNAWQAMPEGGELYLETNNHVMSQEDIRPLHATAGRYVRFTVTDTGVGMERQTMERIFEPFFTTKDMGRGTGLGLASAYGIVKNHGGFINVYSEPGTGATFSVYLPATDKAVVTEKKAPESMVKGTESILLVDDEGMIIEVGTKMLTRFGYKVITARSGGEALEIYRAEHERIDLVVLDMIMPDMSGGETFKHLKAIKPDVKVLLSSGYSINGQAKDILDQGCRGFIQKPFSMRELSQRIRSALE